MKILVLFLAVPALCLEKSETMRSELHEIQLNSSAGVLAALDMLPKECRKNGKTFKIGEEFEFGKLRYKCQEYGVYSIEGCVGKDKKAMKIGESQLVDNVKYQCLAMGNSVYFRETTCGTMGQPDCDHIPLPTGFEEAVKKNGGKAEKVAEGTNKIGDVVLPKGWRLVDGGTKKVAGTNASVVTQVLMFNPISRARRQAAGQHGVGRVIGVEDLSGGDSGRPQMPMGNAGKSTQQHVGANLRMVKAGDKHDSDLVDLNERREQKIGGAGGMKPGTVAGHKSITDWKGKTINVNGKSIGAGPGTFTFGNHPTGEIFLKKEN